MTTICLCGAPYDTGEKFCGDCGMLLPGWVTCPHCSREIELDSFCSACGRDLKNMFSAPNVKEGVWERGVEDFAVNLSEEAIEQVFQGSLVIRHGTKALLFENGNLVQEVTSGRHSTQQGGLVNRLFKEKRRLSVMLVDAGDITMNFKVAEMKTKEGLFADLGLDLVLRLSDPTAFFVNVIKEKSAFKIFELRRLLFSSLQEVLKESCRQYTYEELTEGPQIRQKMRSHLEAGLRETLRRSGLEVADVTTLAVGQEQLDAIDREAADDQLTAAQLAAQAKGRQAIGSAEVDAKQSDRGIDRLNLEEDKADLGLEMDTKDFDNQRKQAVGQKDIEGQFIDVDLYRKRIEVLKAVKAADVDKIKTEEDFRKFKMEADRDQVLDAAEWAAFKDEILWKDEDRKRDRAFLTAKVELMQVHELAMIKLGNQHELTLTQQKNQALVLEEKLKSQLSLLNIKAQGEGQANLEKVKWDEEAKRLQALTPAQIDAEKTRLAIQLEEEKEDARDRIIQKKKARGAKGWDLKNKIQSDKLVLKKDERSFEEDIEDRRAKRAREAKVLDREHEREQKKMTEQHDLEMTKLQNSTETESLRIRSGMTEGQIAAEKDPSAYADNRLADEKTTMLERMIEEKDRSRERETEISQRSEERMERMIDKALGGKAIQNQETLDAERKNAETAERMAGQAMTNMKDVASTARQQAPSAEGGVVHRCPECKQDMPEGTNFCKNCGTKMY